MFVRIAEYDLDCIDLCLGKTFLLFLHIFVQQWAKFRWRRCSMMECSWLTWLTFYKQYFLHMYSQSFFLGEGATFREHTRSMIRKQWVFFFGGFIFLENNHGVSRSTQKTILAGFTRTSWSVTRTISWIRHTTWTTRGGSIWNWTDWCVCVLDLMI